MPHSPVSVSAGGWSKTQALGAFHKALRQSLPFEEAWTDQDITAAAHLFLTRVYTGLGFLGSFADTLQRQRYCCPLGIDLDQQRQQGKRGEKEKKEKEKEKEKEKDSNPFCPQLPESNLSDSHTNRLPDELKIMARAEAIAQALQATTQPADPKAHLKTFFLDTQKRSLSISDAAQSDCLLYRTARRGWCEGCARLLGRLRYKISV
eukprot:g7857.t1